MFCPKCGADNQEGAYNCHKCGRVLRSKIVTRDGSREPTAAERMLMPVGRSAWAIAAGYAGLFGLLVLPAPIALALSVLAMFDLKRNPKKHGWGRAIFGFVIGLLGSGLLIWVFALDGLE